MAISESTGNSEQVSVSVTAGQTYYLRVYGYNGAVNPNYSLSINVPESGGGSPAGVYYLSTTAGGTLTSTGGGPNVTFADADILQLTIQANGLYQYQLHFDGSDVGLSTTNNEDVNALDVRETGGNPTLFFSTLGNFSVTGSSGANEDVFAFNPTTLGSTTAGTFGPGLAFDGSLHGLASFGIDGIRLPAPPAPSAPLALADAPSGSASSASLQAVASATALEQDGTTSDYPVDGVFRPTRRRV